MQDNVGQADVVGGKVSLRKFALRIRNWPLTFKRGHVLVNREKGIKEKKRGEVT